MQPSEMRTPPAEQGTDGKSAETSQGETVSPKPSVVVKSRPVKQSPWRLQNIVAVLTANGRMTVGICILGFFVLLAILGPLINSHNPHTLYDALLSSPSVEHWFGTNRQGKDIFAQIAYGARVSLIMSFIAAVGATLLSLIIGLTAGYFGGWIDDVLSFLTNVFLVIPGVPLAIVIASFAVKGPMTIALVLVFTSWPWGARVLRSQTLSMRQREYVTAAHMIGENPWRIIASEILPNQIAIVASGFVGTFTYAAIAAVALEFLGLGDSGVISWGTTLYWAQADNALGSGLWWLFVPPGLCVAVLCAGLSFINFGIDELANPALRREPRVSKKRKAIA